MFLLGLIFFKKKLLLKHRLMPITTQSILRIYMIIILTYLDQS